MHFKKNLISNLFHATIMIFWGWFTMPYNSFSQTPKACFTSKDTLGCVPYTVTMDECTGGASTIRYKYGNGAYTLSNTHTFTNPGEYTITQLIPSTTGNGDNVLTKTNYIKVILPVLPVFEILYCNNRRVNVKITDTQFPKYIIDFGDGQTLETRPNSDNLHTYLDTNPKNITVTGQFISGVCPTTSTKVVNPVDNVAFENFFSVLSDNGINYHLNFNANKNYSYTFSLSSGNVLKSFANDDGAKQIDIQTYKDSCISMNSVDACGTGYTTPSLCVHDLALNTTDTSVTLNWPARNIANVITYNVYRDNVLISSTNTPNTLNYEDNSVKCGKNYCYKLESVLNQGIIFSLSRCITAVSNKIPDKPENIVASFSDDNTLTIRWSIPKSSSFKAAFLTSNGKTISENRDTSFSSKKIFDGCFSLSYKDSCDKTSETISDICPIILKVKDEGRGIYSINWNSYSLASNISYTLYEDDKVIYSGNQISFTTIEPDTVNQLKIFKVIASYANQSVQSNTIEMRQEMKVFLPTAFSPNDDGLNDVFLPKTRFVKTYKIGIFNIWGELVFTGTTKNNGWSGDRQQNNTYNYVAEAEDYLGNKKTFRGQVTLIR